MADAMFYEKVHCKSKQKSKQKSLLQTAAAMFNEKMNSNPQLLCLFATTEETGGGVLLRNLFSV